MVDVIIAAYNCEKTICKCINSLLKQTYKDINIVVVNDGSTDKTLDILKKIKKTANNVIIFDKKNGGAASARNYGLLNSKSPFFTFVDSDDYVKENYILDMIYKQKENDYDLVISNYEKTNKHSSYTSNLCKEFNLSDNYEKKVYDLISKYNADGICAKLYKREKLDKIIMKQQQIGEDLLFNIQFIENCDRVAYIPNCNYIYVISGSSLMNKPCLNLLNDLSINYKNISNDLLKTIYCFRIYSEYIKNIHSNKKKYERIPIELYKYMRKRLKNIKSIIGNKKFYYYKISLFFYSKKIYFLVNLLDNLKKILKEI